MMKANITPADDRRAALAMLGFIHGDSAQIAHVMDEAAQAPAGAAALVLALAEAATSYITELCGSEEEAANQLTQMILKIAEQEHNK